MNENQSSGARDAKDSDDQQKNVTHGACVVGDDPGVQQIHVTHSPCDSGVIYSIVYNHRLKVRWHKSEKSETLSAKALLRSLCDGDKKAANDLFDKAYAAFTKAGAERDAAMAEAVGAEIAHQLSPYMSAILGFETNRVGIAKSLEKLAKRLPVWPWVEECHGFGAGNLAAIVGSAGDVGSYKSGNALWKRMGLAVIEGRRQRKVATKEGAEEQKYSPERRSIVWILAGCLMKSKENPYRSVYLEHKAIQIVKCEAIAKDPAEARKYCPLGGKYSPKLHANNRANRYVGKRAILQLYHAWRAIERGEPALPGGSPPRYFKDGAEIMLQAAE